MSPPGRPLRADAKRNREHLVAVAREAFATADTAVPLESIAREAGVGIGTLYRHFPTRDALFEAVYAAELDDLTTSAPALLGELPPDAALRAWLGRYAQFVAMKRGMVDALRTGLAAGRLTPPPASGSPPRSRPSSKPVRARDRCAATSNPGTSPRCSSGCC